MSQKRKSQRTKLTGFQWIARFWSRVRKADGCWVWAGHYTSEGYGSMSGSFWGNNGSLPAHRISYIIHKGDVPRGFQVDHLCRNRFCVNPDHLEAVTPNENSRRIKDLMTDEKVAAVRDMLRAGFSTTEVAEKFCASKALIKKIRQGVLWRDHAVRENSVTGQPVTIRRTNEQFRSMCSRAAHRREAKRRMVKAAEQAISTE